MTYTMTEVDQISMLVLGLVSKTKTKAEQYQRLGLNKLNEGNMQMTRKRVFWQRNTVPKSMHLIEQAMKRRGVMGRPPREPPPNFNGNDLRLWRISRKMTQSELCGSMVALGLLPVADVPNLTQSTLSGWERGRTVIPAWLPERLQLVHEHFKQFPANPIGQACIELDSKKDQTKPDP